jgi:hypothetical protein
MSLSLRLSWIVVVAALMLLAVLGSARAQEPQRQAAPHCIALAMAHAVDVQTNR